MTSEQFLNSLRHMDFEIAALDSARSRLMDRRRDILDQAEHLGAGLNGVCVQSPMSSKTENLGVQLADLVTPQQLAQKLSDYQARINRKIDELVDKKRVAMETIELVRDARLKAILLNRYINCYKWSTIADLMGYTQGWVESTLKQEAIQAYDKAKTTM